MPLRSVLTRAIGMLLLVNASACSVPAVAKRRPTDEVLWRSDRAMSGFAASPQGRLFVATGELVYYADGPQYSKWRLVAALNDVVINLVAPASDGVFLISRGSVARYSQAGDTWTKSAELSWDQGLFVLDAWARSEDDFYVVGAGAAIVHFDGHDWIREHNPLDSIATAPSPRVLYSGVWAVGGGSDGPVYAASWNQLLARMDGKWVTIGTNPDTAFNCPVTALLSPGSDGALVGSHEPTCLHRVTRGEWRVEHDPLFERIGPTRSRVQVDGTTLAWAGRTGTVIVFRDSGETVFQFDDLHGVAGMAMVGDQLFAGGIRLHGARGAEAVVVRQRL